MTKIKIFLFSFLMSVCFYTPIFATYFENYHNMTNSQVTLLFFCYTLSVFIFEIPTGLLSDKIGEKKSLLIGSLLVCISTSFFLFGNFILIFIGELLFGISRTFFSGSFESYIFHYTKIYDEKYGNILSKAYTCQWIALCFSFIGCSIISKITSLRYVFFFTLSLNIFCLISSFFIPKIEKQNKSRYLNIFVNGIIDLKSNKQLLSSAIFNAFFLSFLICGYHIFQLYIEETSLIKDVSLNGFIYFLGALFASMGSVLFEKKENKILSKKIV